MLKYRDLVLFKVILLLFSVSLLIFIPLTHAANEVKENSSDEYDQLRKQSPSSGGENQLTPSGSGRKAGKRSANMPRFLSLTISRSKTNLIKRKEYELKNKYSNFAVYPKQTGHHWNLPELSDPEALNVCYSLWLGLTFNEIDEIDKTDLPSQLYAFCRKFKRIPIGDIGYTGQGNFCYNIVYPYTEKNFRTKTHRIGVLKCVCTFTKGPHKKHTCQDSNKCFFAHKLKDNEYLILSPISKERYEYQDLEIIDVQKVDPATVHVGDKRSIPISTNQTSGDTEDEFDQIKDECSSSSYENQATTSASRSILNLSRPLRADSPKYLSLSVSQSKMDLITQKESELLYNYAPSDYIWNISQLSENETANVCYSLWLGFTFNEIDDIDKTYLPLQLYAYCKSKKIPIGDKRDRGTSRFRYKIVFPRTENDLNTKLPIGVLQCVCRFTNTPTSRFINHDSNRKFYAHKLQYNEYLILSPVSKDFRYFHNLEIIDIQEIDSVFLHFGDKRYIPILTN